MTHRPRAARPLFRRIPGLTAPLLIAACSTPPTPPASSAPSAPAPAADTTAAPAPAPPSANPAWISAPAPTPPATPPPNPAAWIAIGGVSSPADFQRSIADELLAVRDTLGPDRGILLAGGGPGSHGVQVLDRETRSPITLQVLSTLLDPRPGRDAHFEPLSFQVHGPATAAALEGALAVAMAAPSDAPRLTLWLAGHGAPGDTPDAVTLATWQGPPLTPAALERALAGVRPARIIATTCFSGAFSEAIANYAPRICGSFATTWDLEASGCDSDPNRARDSYGALLLAALQEPKNDLNADGVIGLAEAHVAATIAGPGIEVPSLSSQLALAHALDLPESSSDLEQIPPSTPFTIEEHALLAGLLGRMKLTPESANLAQRFDTLASDEAKTADTLARAEQDEALAAEEVRSALIARWPALDDPWHPDFQPTLRQEGPAIEAWLNDNPLVQTWNDRADMANRTRDRLDTLRATLAPVHRALIAADALRRVAYAQSIAATDPNAARTLQEFQDLRACEREALP